MRRPNRTTPDQQPGTTPHIQNEAGSVTYRLRPDGTPLDSQLVIRCDPQGEIWVSIQHA
jgi:hypothetical protein